MRRHHKQALLICFAMSLMGMSGCEWENPLYDEFVMSDAGGRAVICEGLQYIMINGDACYEEDVETEERCSGYANSFKYGICPKHFSCSNDANGNNYCDDHSGCNESQKRCNGICIAFDSVHVASCDNDVIVCQEHYANCDGIPDNGCEVSLANDSQNCGKCGTECGTKEACVGGVCMANDCALGYHLYVDDKGKTVCEENTDMNCGRHNNVCANEMAGWDGGKCSQSGVCEALKCIKGYHLTGSTCVADTNDWCGNHENCYETDNKGTNIYIDNGDHCGCNITHGYTCDLGECVISKCHNGMTECMGECIDFSSTHVVGCNTERIECAADYLDCDGQVTNGCEVYSLNDNMHCGACEGESVECLDGEICSGGQCQLSCQYGLTNCGGTCVDLIAGNADGCEGTTFSCKPGFADCDQNVGNGCEVNTEISNIYCGARGVCDQDSAEDSNYKGEKCASGLVCSEGSCGLSCQHGLTNCGGTCVDLVAGNADSCNGNVLVCKTGFANCDGNVANGCEVDTTTSNKYCGAKGTCIDNSEFDANYKGKTCEAGFVCSNSTCGLSCQNGLTNCGGTCVDLANGNATACYNTSLTCKTGFANCDGRVANGCEVNTTNSNQYCGAKGTCTSELETNSNYKGQACEKGNVCSGSKCGLSCQQGLTNCGGTCVDLANGNASQCSSTTLTCINGYANCDGRVSNGCEVNTTNSNQYCGAKGTCTNASSGNTNYKGKSCDPGFVCSNSTCNLSCQNGFTKCGDVCVNLDKGNAESCNGTTLTCKTGFANCDGRVENGCEVNTTNSNQYCGAKGICNNNSDSNSNYKGKSCDPGFVCSNSTCNLSCQGGFTKCDNVCVNLDKGNAESCNGTTLTCKTGFANCDNRIENGCEVNTTNSNQYCGAKGICNNNTEGNDNYKGKACDPGFVCSDSKCNLSCQDGFTKCGDVCVNLDKGNAESCDGTTLKCKPGFANCDGQNENGCELNTQRDNLYCGAKGLCNHDDESNDNYKGKKCQSGFSCSSGTCVESCLGTQNILCDGKCYDKQTLSLYHRDASCNCVGIYAGGDAINACKTCNNEVGFAPNDIHSECVACIKNMAVNKDHTACVICEDGFAPNTNHSECVACTGSQAENDDHSACVECTGAKIPNPKHTACVACEANTIPNSEHTECIACTDDTVPNATHTQCIACTGNQVANSTNTQCIACTDDTVPNATHTQCVACTRDQVANPTNTQCVTCTDNSVPNATHTQCIACTENQVANSTNTQCIACTDDTVPNETHTQCIACTGNLVANPTNTQCVTCTDNTVPNETHTQCIACTGNQVSNPTNTECVDCSGIGSIPNSSHTQCVCDTANHFEEAADGCKCITGYTLSDSESECVKNDPGE